MAPGQTMHQQLQHSVPHPDSSSNAQGIMYSNEVTPDLSANPHHTQINGTHQSEELYKRSIMLVIWYKVSYIFLECISFCHFVLSFISIRFYNGILLRSYLFPSTVFCSLCWLYFPK